MKKTPGQILRDRHAAAGPLLDARRELFLDGLSSGLETERPGEGWMAEVLRGWRWNLAGLGAAWALAALFNFEGPASVGMVAQAGGVGVPEPGLVAALREHRRQILDLLEIPSTVGTDQAAPSPSPRRRSDLAPLDALA